MTIPAALPGLGGPDPAKVIGVLGISTMVCGGLSIWTLGIARRLRKPWWSLFALAPASYVAVMLIELAMSIGS